MGVRQTRLEDYDGFVAKFEAKRTTDDCYTPPEVYDAVAGYVADRWGVDRAAMVRPFWPGGNFESFDYPPGCCVVDNPPFSILARIKEFYLEAGVHFFLFAPSLTLLSGGQKAWGRVDHIVANITVTYENGAEVRTGFVTDLEPGTVLESAPDLGDIVNAANDRALRRAKAEARKELPKYVYPDEVLTAARCQWLAAHHTPLRVRASDCCFIRRLDAQISSGKTAFGGALLLSERAAAERAAATRWPLSERERAIVALLGQRSGDSEEAAS